MKKEELQEEIEIERELIEAILKELESLYRDVEERTPTLREKTAAAAFLAQFYGGIENILKRICRFSGIPLPTGETWHSDLFKMFCIPPFGSLPPLFDHALERRMAPYRKFRHVAFHSYGIQVDWDRMKEGIDGVEDVFENFRHNLDLFLFN